MFISFEVFCTFAGVTGGPERKNAGAVVFLDLKTHALVRRVGMPGAVTGIVWNARINSILVGTGDRTSGGTHVLYDPTMSEKGALMCVGKAVRVKDPFDFEPPLMIHTPGALPMFRDDQHRKRKRGGDGVVCFFPANKTSRLDLLFVCTVILSGDEVCYSVLLYCIVSSVI